MSMHKLQFIFSCLYLNYYYSFENQVPILLSPKGLLLSYYSFFVPKALTILYSTVRKKKKKRGLSKRDKKNLKLSNEKEVKILFFKLIKNKITKKRSSINEWT